MPDTKISALATLSGASLASGDLFVAVDVSDLTMAVTGTDVKITAAQLAIGLSPLLVASTIPNNYYSGGTDVAVVDGGTGASTAAGARTNLGLVIGTDVQAFHALLAAIVALSPTAADQLIYSSGVDTLSLASLTAFARSILDDTDAITVRATLGLVIGTDVQAFDAELAAIAGLTSAADRLPYFTGSGTAALATFTAFGRSLVDDATAADARTTLGLGTIATQAASAVSITGGSITGITDLAVADGGTGASTAADARTNLGISASNTPFTPAGELISTDVQNAMEELDTRLSPVAFLEQADVADVFFDNFHHQHVPLSTDLAYTHFHGPWQVLFATSSTSTAAMTKPVGSSGDPPGMTNLSTGAGALSDVNGVALHLGLTSFGGGPVLDLRWRLRLNTLNDGSDDFFLRFGTGDFLGGVFDNTDTDAVDSAGYWLYSPADTTWHFKTSAASTVSDHDTNVTADTNYHVFRQTCDGAGQVRFFIDDVECANSPATPANMPSATQRWGIMAALAKTLGTATGRQCRLDWCGYRIEPL